MNQSSSHIIIFNNQGKVLVVRRSDNDDWEPGKFAIPGGKREDGESLLQNIQRETFEEVGLILDPQKIIFLPNISKKLNHVFFTTNVFKGTVKLGDGEHSEFGWINPKQLSEEESVPNLALEIEEARKLMCDGIKIKIGPQVSEDLLPGGKGDNASPEDFDRNEVARGIHVEMEHTNDPRIALEITLDHLVEDPQYYAKLATIEKD